MSSKHSRLEKRPSQLTPQTAFKASSARSTISPKGSVKLTSLTPSRLLRWLQADKRIHLAKQKHWSSWFRSLTAKVTPLIGHWRLTLPFTAGDSPVESRLRHWWSRHWLTVATRAPAARKS